jgi:inward rectifier potassium channel
MKPNEPLIQTNTKIDPFRDLYYWFILMSWPSFVGVLSIFFIVLNLIYGGIYFMIGGLKNVGPSFADHVFFSVHTVATVGYGNVFPDSFLANIVASSEIILGLFMMALMTGLIFAKFSRPSARIIFSKFAVIHQRHGEDCLVFRVANKRGHHIAEASLNVVAIKKEITPEGDTMRKLYTLQLERAQTPLFVLSWMVIHRITPDSPIYGLSSDDFQTGDVRILLSLTGHDSILGQTTHARHIYSPDDIKFGYRLKDAVKTLDLDFDTFHEIEEIGGSPFFTNTQPPVT